MNCQSFVALFKIHRIINTFLGGGLVVGRVDSEGEFSGPNIAYIYPDFR